MFRPACRQSPSRLSLLLARSVTPSIDQAMRIAVLLTALSTTACLPIPNRIRDTPDVSGRLLAAALPLADFEVATIRESRPLSAPPTCGVGGSLARTDSTGAFHLPEHKHWEWWVALLGESPEWDRAWTLCARPTRAGTTAWRAVYRATSNLWDPISLLCDTTAV